MNRNRKPEWIDIHNVKVLKSGNSLYMDCDLTIPWYYNIEQGHKIGARLQEAMKAKYSDHAVLNIHLDHVIYSKHLSVISVCAVTARIAKRSL